jgi:hypothetical protein
MPTVYTTPRMLSQRTELNYLCETTVSHSYGQGAIIIPSTLQDNAVSHFWFSDTVKSVASI